MKQIKIIVAVLAFIQVNYSIAQNPSDGCAGVPALPVNGSCSSQAFSLPGSYSNGGLVMSGTCVGGNDRDDGWYSVTATSTGTMTIDATGDLGYALVVWTACGGGTELTCDEQNALPASVSFAATNGTTYYVQVHRRSGNGTATMAGTICAHMPGAGGGTHDIGTGNLTACTGTLYDSGGTSDYGNSESFVETYCSDVAGQCISITFNSFSTESCCDELSIYDGSTVGSPLIGTYNGSTSPGTVTGTSGCVTFQWSSDGSVVYPGWDATISCSACPTCIDGIQNGLETGIDCGGPSCSPCPCGLGPVPNDEPCCATVATVNPDALCGSVTSSTIANATASPINPAACGGTEDDDVWFEFVATNASHYIDLINVAGSTTDMYHSLWEGACGAPTLVAGTCSDPNSQTVNGLTIGNTYYVRVYTWTGTAGQTSTFDLCIGTPPPPPTNDDCVNAISAVVNPDAICNNLTPGYTIGATSSMAGCLGTANDDVWFSFVALDPNQQIEILNATGTTDLVHELFSGPCGSLVSLGCSDPNLSTYTGLVVGNTYWVRVYTYSSSGSNTGFDLCITSPCGISGTAPSCSLNYTHSSTAYAPANYNTGSTIAFSDDRFAPSYSSIGFPFCFDGVLYNDVLVSSNGYLIFPGCYSAAPTETSVTAGGYSAYSMYTSVPNTDDAPRNAIMGPWQDIDPSISGSVIRTNIEGVAPNRVFVAKFNTVGMFSCTTDDFTGQIMLYETSYDIEVHIGEKTICSGWNGGGAILGLHNFDGTQSVVPAGYNYPTQWSVPTGSPEGHKFTNNCPECFVPLPIELIEFKGESYEGFNNIEWKTVTEENNDYFVLEHSNGGADFEAIAVIPGAGNSTEMLDYQFRHNTPRDIEYYRLRQVDFNGSTSYSNIISVRTEGSTSLSMYPNPSSGQLFVDVESTKEDVFTISYMDVSGKQSYEEISVNEIHTTYELSGFLTLDKGMYIIQVSDAKGEILATEKIVKK